MKNPLTILELLCDNNKYAIPLYQRNFTWTDKEISLLIIDVLDAIKDKKKEYYIGTLVICKNESNYDIIDGQQRFTALIFISLAIQNCFNGKRYIKNLNLTFTARKKSYDTLKALLNNDKNIEDNEITSGYKNTESALTEYVGKDEYKKIKMMDFYEYLLNKVKIFINEMPEKTNVNLYFERFNSRGEQLEFHEIIKAELMQRLFNDTNKTIEMQKFGKIWDACSDFETPCIKYFRKIIKRTDDNDEREKIFRCVEPESAPGQNSWLYNYDLPNNIFKYILVNNENKRELLSSFTEQKIDEDEKPDLTNRYRCIINFNTFLYYVLYITDEINIDNIQLDDKKLKDAFKVNTRDREWILRFGKNLLQCKFLFDNFVIRQAQETTDRLKEGQWFLHKAYREDKKEKTNRFYVQTRFDKNSFLNKNDEIIMLQSMFAVTFTAYKDTKWLYATMKYLFDNAKNLNQHLSGNHFYSFLEQLSKRRSKEMLGTVINKDKMRYDNGVPIYVFNLVDYVLWKNRSTEKKSFPDIKFEEFSFAYRRSIEHWFPQNPNNEESKEKMSKELLHSFGNLCLIVASQNSKFGNLYPAAKLDQWKDIFSTQSLKLQMMANITRKKGSWEQKDIKEINDFENHILDLLNTFIKS